MKRDDLWSFALSCYQQPGIEAACLELQAAGADVCLLLTGAWLERRGVACDDARLRQLKDLSDDWRAMVVAPLRTLRQSWRQQAATDYALVGLRERVKALELDAEHIQLQRLQSATQPWPKGSERTNWLGPLCACLSGEKQTLWETLRRVAGSQLATGGD
ncbi:TIGR02444 family protein [Pseudomonas sp. MTM4]|uniref:TIGR02444 family protein n=1 Tax=unclassified Pseudomonas TaxID=196821 RepID=UPI0018D2636B|nr:MULTISPECIES: TIGR02444 family protein [unclassified Pseudomonas]MBC8649771.1 TIGR02444 family protein [Pseudomonas sp. MT4]QXY92119.1 TIGR02444 family protein [Pseudomonas sp. MTM4]